MAVPFNAPWPKSVRRLAAASLAGIAALSGPLLAGESAVNPGLEQLFESRVRPLLVEKCQECHGATVAEAGLRLDSRKGVLAGGDAGPVIVPGDVGKSRLVAAVRHSGEISMPPDGRLSDEEIQALETWIESGAAWSGPGGDGDPAAAGDRSGEMQRRLEEALGNHWSFTPPARHEPPGVAEAATAPGWEASRIDRFILAGVTAAGLSPSPQSPPRELLRRLWFDLVGLPPPADVADAFERNPSEAAYRGHVESLLASREHAEHWARKWLDLARYADTMGYNGDEAENRLPFAWTYRDWVIGSLASDLPYDRFVTLQIAADLVEPAVAKPDLAALGFLTCGRSFFGNVHDVIDDRIDLVTRGLMGLTVACARCHDHKYEPVSTADYYALHGIFDSSHVPEELPEIGEAADGPEGKAFGEKLAKLRGAITDHETAVHIRVIREAVAHARDYFLETARPTPRGADERLPRLADGYEIQKPILDRLGTLLASAEASHPILGPWAAVRSLPDAEIGGRLAALIASWGEEPNPSVVSPLVQDEFGSARPTTLVELAEAYARLAMRVAPAAAGGSADEQPSAEFLDLRAVLGDEGTPLVPTRAEAMQLANREEDAERRKIADRITEHFAESPGGPPKAMVLLDRKQPRDSRILLRGNPARPGDVVKRRLPAVLGGREVSRESSGRLELARAIVSPVNPLTPRVLVNWAWTHHFGRGLVETPGDMGLRGEPPSHRELLDDLARRFIDEGAWSLRWLHRQIVTSAAFRQSSEIRGEMTERDPENRFFARANRRRLDWESWRDSLLSAAGTLQSGHEGGPAVDPLSFDAMHARSVYGRLDRQDVPGLLKVFDVADPDTSVHVRTRTSVPQQSLAALNAPLVVEAATRAAARIEKEPGGEAGDPARIESLWRIVLGRSPDADERSMAIAWLAEESKADAAAVPPQPIDRYARLAHALIATAEFHHVD